MEFELAGMIVSPRDISEVGRNGREVSGQALDGSLGREYYQATYQKDERYRYEEEIAKGPPDVSL